VRRDRLGVLCKEDRGHALIIVGAQLGVRCMSGSRAVHVLVFVHHIGERAWVLGSGGGSDCRAYFRLWWARVAQRRYTWVG